MCRCTLIFNRIPVKHNYSDILFSVVVSNVHFSVGDIITFLLYIIIRIELRTFIMKYGHNYDMNEYASTNMKERSRKKNT